jgi:pimeloyl-ACP methyl ester carboxylesterase
VYARTGPCFLIALLAIPASGISADPSSASSPRGIQEERFVPIGGIEQWITIKGRQRENPVVLFLHGGPGDAYSPFADAMFAGWERELTLVQWDQRGAGRTYAKNGPGLAAAMTVERMVQDGIEVAEFLTHHLHKEKIILVGGSWGSILGIYMIHTRPDLFYAFIGEAQMVSWQKNVAASRAKVLGLARASHDQAAIQELSAIGAPPWHSLSDWPHFRRWQRAYQAKQATEAPPPMTRSPEYDSLEERAAEAAADDFSFLHFVGPTMSGPITRVDLPALGTTFAVPIFMIQGQEDLVAVPELAKAYFDSIKAPRKELYLVPGTGHEGSASELALLQRVLRTEARPLAYPPEQDRSLRSPPQAGGSALGPSPSPPLSGSALPAGTRGGGA